LAAEQRVIRQGRRYRPATFIAATIRTVSTLTVVTRSSTLGASFGVSSD
jgi:hypothetical protein